MYELKSIKIYTLRVSIVFAFVRYGTRATRGLGNIYYGIISFVESNTCAS